MEIPGHIKVIYACCALYNFMKARGEVLVEDQNPTVVGQLQSPEEEAADGQSSDEGELPLKEDETEIEVPRSALDQQGGSRGRLPAGDLTGLGETGSVRRERIVDDLWQQYVEYNRGPAI